MSRTRPDPCAISQAEVYSIAAEALADPRSIRRAYAGKPVRPLIRLRLERAAAVLRLPAPPAYEPGAQPHHDRPEGGWGDEE